MTLDCSCCKCVYNSAGTCYAGKITISGLHSSKSSNTHCATFSQEENLTNLSSNYFTTSSDIACEATNCYYNNQYTCIANSVHINDKNANCDTFVSR